MPAEGHHGNANKTGCEAVSGDEDKGWDTAQDGDLNPESVNTKPEALTGSIAALRERGLEDRSVTSLPAGQCYNNKEAGQPKADVSSDLQPGKQDLLFPHFTVSKSSSLFLTIAHCKKKQTVCVSRKQNRGERLAGGRPHS